MRLVPLLLFQDANFQYQNYLGLIPDEFDPKSMPEFRRETADFEWMTYDDLLKLPNKHFGLQALLDDSKSVEIIEKYIDVPNEDGFDDLDESKSAATIEKYTNEP
jgi:hypothetical protein